MVIREQIVDYSGSEEIFLVKYGVSHEFLFFKIIAEAKEHLKVRVKNVNSIQGGNIEGCGMYIPFKECRVLTLCVQKKIIPVGPIGADHFKMEDFPCVTFTDPLQISGVIIFFKCQEGWKNNKAQHRVKGKDQQGKRE